MSQNIGVGSVDELLAYIRKTRTDDKNNILEVPLDDRSIFSVPDRKKMASEGP